MIATIYMPICIGIGIRISIGKIFSAVFGIESIGTKWYRSTFNWHITAQEHTYKSQHETILANLNQYKTVMRLVIILMDDAINHMCVWPLA